MDKSVIQDGLGGMAAARRGLSMVKRQEEDREAAKNNREEEDTLEPFDLMSTAGD